MGFLVFSFCDLGLESLFAVGETACEGACDVAGTGGDVAWCYGEALGAVEVCVGLDVEGGE